MGEGGQEFFSRHVNHIINETANLSLLILNSQELVLAPKFDYCRPIHRLKALVAAFSLMV